MLTQSASLTAYMIAPCGEFLRIMLQTSLKCTELSEPYRTASVCAAAIHLPLFGDSHVPLCPHVQIDDDHGDEHSHPGQRHCAVALRDGLPGSVAPPLRLTAWSGIAQGERSMPRYDFDLYEGPRFIPNDEGSEFEGPDAAEPNAAELAA